MERNVSPSLLILHMLTILAFFVTLNYAVQSDIDCLISIKNAVQDPENMLSSWDFNNNTEGFICRFTGIQCWHPDESKVLNIRLSDMALRGPFPTGLKNCTSLTGLDLSSNHFTGEIPTNLTDFMPFLTTLDLSSNNLSGQIPSSFANLSFLNVLRLDNNQFTGQIPLELPKLSRIKAFSVANNRLSGPVPMLPNGTIINYANNLGLCGGDRLPACKINGNNHHDLFYTGFAVGFPFSTLVTLLIVVYLSPRLSTRNMRYFLLLMVNKIKGKKHHLIPRSSHILLTEQNNSDESKIIAMEKYVRRLSLEELKLATNDFDTKRVIGYGNMGLMYKAMFPNGLMLAVKRLHKFESFEEEFLLETKILGRLRHTNLVPLLCFCFEMEKKFLVYKYMSNGTLHQWLHSKPQVEGTKKMGWSLRLKIAVGIARGLAWLHHNNVLRVAHLKINSKCILLDDKFEPKISNFGNSNITVNTNVIISRDFTFVDPHSSRGSYWEDVYSFGILLLELVSGREWPSKETELSVRDSVFIEEFNMIDEGLMGQGFYDDICETLRIAKNCIRSHKDGATSMLEVYQSIRTIGISRNKISDNLLIDLEGSEEDM